MKNDIIYRDIKAISSVTKAAKAIGCTTQSLRNKLGGITPWKVTDIVSLARHFRWTVEEFLNIIDYTEESEEQQ